MAVAIDNMSPFDGETHDSADCKRMS